MFAMIIFIAFLNGTVLLPVILSFVGAPTISETVSLKAEPDLHELPDEVGHVDLETSRNEKRIVVNSV